MTSKNYFSARELHTEMFSKGLNIHSQFQFDQIKTTSLVKSVSFSAAEKDRSPPSYKGQAATKTTKKTRSSLVFFIV